MGNDTVFFSVIGTFCGFFLGLFVGLFVGLCIQQNQLQTKAIQANCGHYNSISGSFEWGPSLIAEKKDDNNL